MKLRDILMTAALSIPIAFGAVGCGDGSGNSAKNSGNPAPVDRASGIVLSYATQPSFANADLLKQTTGTDVELHIVNVDEGKAYFSVPRVKGMKKDIESLCKNTHSLEYGTFEDGRSKLGRYSLNSTDVFFRMPVENFKIKPNAKITIPYDGVSYTINMNELADFSENKSIYGGRLLIPKSPGKVFANHGAFIAKKGEKSLSRFVNQLVPKGSSKEQTAQKLLDFVSNQIGYNHSEASRSIETLKRPNEVLMTKNSDCSGITILYGSLLEQTGIDYRLFYLDDHICVGVEGDFDQRNERVFKVGDKTFFIAEPTVKGYKIGRTRVNRAMKVKDISGIQKPSDFKIYNPRKGRHYDM